MIRRDYEPEAFFQRARAALRADALRCFAVSFRARDRPPFRPVAWNIASTAGGSVGRRRRRFRIGQEPTMIVDT
jgi:hypothetical protein